MDKPGLTLLRGLPESSRADAVEIFEAAFGAKLSLAMPSAEKRRAVIGEGLIGNNLIVVVIDGELAGMAALATRSGHYAGGSLSADSVSWSMLRRHLGTFGAIRAALVLLLYQHKPKDDELYLEELAVAPAARGRGMGSRLLAEVEAIAREEGKARVELQVIDTNPSAQELYARHGYVVTRTDRFGFLRRILGFGGVYTMDLFLDEEERARLGRATQREEVARLLALGQLQEAADGLVVEGTDGHPAEVERYRLQQQVLARVAGLEVGVADAPLVAVAAGDTPGHDGEGHDQRRGGHERLPAGGTHQRGPDVGIAQRRQRVLVGQVARHAFGADDVRLQRLEVAGGRGSAPALAVGHALGRPQQLADLVVRERVGLEVAHGVASREGCFEGHAAVGARRGQLLGRAVGIHGLSLPAGSNPALGPSVVSGAWARRRLGRLGPPSPRYAVSMSGTILGISHGLPEHLRAAAGDVLEVAFGEQNRLTVPDRDKRVVFMREVIAARNVVVATRGDELLGLVGLSTRGDPHAGGLVEASWDPRPHVALLGWAGAAWAVWGMRLGARSPKADEVYVDGLAVAPAVRGQGVGTRLLAEVDAVARAHGKRFVRLDVVDTNPRAQALYERLGYRVTKVQSFRWKQRWTGFGAMISMERAVDPEPTANP